MGLWLVLIRRPLMALSGRATHADKWLLRGNNGHEADVMRCPLMTHSGHQSKVESRDPLRQHFAVELECNPLAIAALGPRGDLNRKAPKAISG